MDSKWLAWARRLQAIAQNGLTFNTDPFDRERYEQVRRIAEEIVAGHSQLNDGAIRDLLRGEEGYATPKVDVRGAVFHENRLLLVREKTDGLWTVPGGWADVGESPTEAIIREIREESGFETKVGKLVALYDRSRHEHPPMLFHVYKAFFVCEIIGGSASVGTETTAVEFFREDRLPSLSTARVTTRQIERLFAHHANRALATEFD